MAVFGDFNTPKKGAMERPKLGEEQALMPVESLCEMILGHEHGPESKTDVEKVLPHLEHVGTIMGGRIKTVAAMTPVKGGGQVSKAIHRSDYWCTDSWIGQLG